MFQEITADTAAPDRAPTWLEVLSALSIPTAVVGAAIAMGYSEGLLLGHYIANVLLLAASFGVQSISAAFVGRVLYRRGARATLAPFALTLVPHEVFFAGITALLLVAPSRGGLPFGLVLALLCTVWNLLLTYAFFRALGTRLRGLLGVVLHFSNIAILVGLYMRAQDLLPYPPGRP